MLKPFKTTLIATLFSLGLSTTAVADSAHDLVLKGLEASTKEDYKTAAKYFQKAADQGDLNAKSLLGTMYMMGRGVKANIPKGAKMIQDACNLGDSQACNTVQQIKNICAETGAELACEAAPYFK